MTTVATIAATNPAARREPVICAMATEVGQGKRGQRAATHPDTMTGSSM
jgi:hypothetical protein